MRVARWRWLLVPMIVVVAGCLPQPPTAELPKSFIESFATGASTFRVQTPPAGGTHISVQDNVAALHAGNPSLMLRARVVSILGLIDCHGDTECYPAQRKRESRGTERLGAARPDCKAPFGDDIGWVVVDADRGVGHGYALNTGASGRHRRPRRRLPELSAGRR